MASGPQITAVGVVGLGTMGGPMAAHLVAAGNRVTGFDVRTEAVDGLVAAGGRAAASPAEVASASSIVITSLPSVNALRAVVSGDGGISEGSHPDLVVVEASTLPLDAKQWCHDHLAKQGVTVLDCPLSGTGGQMRVKDIAVYASGDAMAITGCKGVLAGFSRAVYDVGPFGNGSRMKFIANHLVTIHNVAAAEALLLARRAGLDLGTVLAAVTDGAGTSRMLEVRGPMMIAGDYSDATMRGDTYQKDIDIIGSFGRDLRCPLPLFAASAQFYLAALAQGRAAQDTASVFAVLESMLEGHHGAAPGTLVD